MFSTSANKLKRCLQVLNTQRVMQASNLHLEQVINLSAYPIHQPESQIYKDLVSFHQDQLRRNGVTTLPELITKEAITEAVKEVEEKADMSYTMQTDHNIYLRKTDETKPITHVSNQRLDTKVAALACDELAEEGPLKVVFKSNSFLSFVQQILNRPFFHRNVDPVGAVFVNIYNDGYSHNWHFDESQWSTTILLQEAEVGGDFQYTKPFRNEEDESQTYEIATKVIAGDGEYVKTLRIQTRKH
eukprot:TRINITY_DN15374_c0_g1_i1.p1 TRINITY_DN15374_c0_g1~~TRINITY_DN15374_c0_g1_i1.p1  ORF type:complete len:244 (+),score=54.94 TRINITY_DN15374_c0_g1_i1:93-824(+)